MNTTMCEAMFWTALPDGKIRCELCPHHCALGEGQNGICENRGVREGKLYSLYYGLVSCPGQVDPIEKKPLFNFYPGTKVLSFGGIGCNLKCIFCQNSEISQCGIGRNMYPFTGQKILRMAQMNNCRGVAWTYNEPTIWFESNYEWSKPIKEAGLYTVYVTNGYIETEPLKKLAGVIDAMNIDVKAFTPEFYRNITHSKLESVLNTCILAKKLGIHIELTYLIIPTLNDSKDELNRYLDWVEKELGKNVPLHFSRFHPDYKLTDLPPTPEQTVIETVEMAQARGFLYVYSGNIWGGYESTFCPNCKERVISRTGYRINSMNITKDRTCSFCGAKVDVVM